jgi:hypothetical protein
MVVWYSTAEAAMQAFCEKHAKKIHGVLSCFDRMLFRGYLPIMSGASMAQFLQSEQVNCGNLKQFLLETSERVKGHAQRMAAAAGRPYIYLPGAGVRMEQQARELAERDGISEGLICVFAKVEPCKSFSFKYSKGDAYVNSAKRKCLHIYYYFMEPELGLVHVQIQGWFPLRMQVFMNGHDWLARKLDAAGIGYTQCDNVFVWIEDLKRAQRFCDRMNSLDWPSILNALARRVNPLMGTLLGRMQYYWVTAQCEYSTDVMFKARADLKELYPRLISHSTLCFGAREVLGFLGKKLDGRFRGEQLSDLTDRFKRRRFEIWTRSPSASAPARANRCRPSIRWRGKTASCLRHWPTAGITSGASPTRISGKSSSTAHCWDRSARPRRSAPPRSPACSTACMCMVSSARFPDPGAGD